MFLSNIMSKVVCNIIIQIFWFEIYTFSNIEWGAIFSYILALPSHTHHVSFHLQHGSVSTCQHLSFTRIAERKVEAFLFSWFLDHLKQISWSSSLETNLSANMPFRLFWLSNLADLSSKKVHKSILQVSLFRKCRRKRNVCETHVSIQI